MDIQTRKISFIQEFLKVQNEEIITTLENVLYEKKMEVAENQMKPMSLEKFHSEIDQSVEDSKNDRVIKATDLKEKIRQWS